MRFASRAARDPMHTNDQRTVRLKISWSSNAISGNRTAHLHWAANVSMQTISYCATAPWITIAPSCVWRCGPTLYQLYENISISNITGKCGTIVQIFPWKQFFNLEGSTEKPFGTIRNISFSNISVSCSKFAELEGNAADLVSDINFKNITATAPAAEFKNKYGAAVKTENVLLNGKPVIIK